MKLLTPGPVMVPPAVLEAAARQVISHRGEGFRRLMQGLQEKLLEVAGMHGGFAAVMPGSGTTAVDSMLWSLVKPRSRILVLSWGDFGERIAKSLHARGAHVEVARAPWGEALDPGQVEDLIQGHEYVAVVHNETSTGVAYRSLKKLAEAVQARGAKLLVDTVSGLGGEEIRMKWGIYAAATCSHKALAAPPGVGIVFLSSEAVRDLERGGTVNTPPILDLDRYRVFMGKSETPFTPPVTLLYALDKALDLILEEGVEERIRRHGEKARLLYESGIPPLAREDLRSNTVVALKVEDASKVKRMLEEHGYIVATGMKHLKEKVIRIGTMGSTGLDDVRRVASLLEEIITK